MKRTIVLLVLGMTAFGWAIRPSAGHGGSYPPPPLKPVLPLAGVPGLPVGGPIAPRIPGPYGPAPPAAPGPEGPMTPFGMAMDISGWDWWWLYNHEPYLDLKTRVLTGAPGTGSDEFFLGHGTRHVPEGMIPDDDDRRTIVGPALQRVIETEKSDRVLCDAMIALATLHPVYAPSGEQSMKELFSTRLAHSSQKVVEFAVLALGLMAEPDCVPILCDIAEGGEGARRWLRRSSVPARIRSLAALAVGVVGTRCEREDVRRYIVSRLARILQEKRTASPDLFVACVTSIGLSPLSPRRRAIEAGVTESPASSREGQVKLLADLLNDRRRHEYVRAHIPKALGLLVRGTDGAAKEICARSLLGVLSSGRKDKRLVRHGVVEGLGLVGDSDDDEIDLEIRRVLHRSMRNGDTFQRQLTLIAIALVSSRPGSGEGERLGGLKSERGYLLEQLVRGKSRIQPWAALALGLQGFHGRESDSPPPDVVLRTLRTTMEDVASPVDVGAWCVALGLCGDLDSAPALRERLTSVNDDAALGRVAVSLGLLNDRQAKPQLRQLVAGASFRPTILREGSIGLALLGDKQVIDDLLETLRSRRSLAIQSAAVTSLGFVADKRAIAPLAELLEDPEQRELTRAYAAIALGTICERHPLSWATLYSCHFNYEAATETLISRAGTGILDMR
jgi:HEAT repeat protein